MYSSTCFSSILCAETYIVLCIQLIILYSMFYCFNLSLDKKEWPAPGLCYFQAMLGECEYPSLVLYPVA